MTTTKTETTRVRTLEDLKKKDRTQTTPSSTTTPSAFSAPQARINASGGVFSGSTVTGQASGIGADVSMPRVEVTSSSLDFTLTGRTQLNLTEAKVKDKASLKFTLSEVPLTPPSDKHEARIADLEKRLQMDQQTKEEQKAINADPALKQYYEEVRQISWCFISSQALAGGQVGDAKGKIDTGIALVGAGVASVPVPGMGVVAEVGKEIASHYNSKAKLEKAKHLALWSVDTTLGSHMAECLARKLTLEQQNMIQRLAQNDRTEVRSLNQRIKKRLEKFKSTKKCNDVQKLAIADMLEIIQAIQKGEIEPSKDIDYVKQLESSVEKMLEVLDITLQSPVQEEDFRTPFPSTTSEKDTDSKQVKPPVLDPGSSSSSTSDTTGRTIAALRADRLEGPLKKPVAPSIPPATSSIPTTTRTTPIPVTPTITQTSTHRFTTTTSDPKDDQEKPQVISTTSTEEHTDEAGMTSSATSLTSLEH